MFDAAAGVRRRHQTKAACELASVGEGAPAEDLLDQHPGALRPNGPQPHQLFHQRLFSLGEFSTMRAFNCSDLILDELQALGLSFELGTHQRRYLAAMSVPPPWPVPTTDHDTRTEVVQHQQRADAVCVRDALVRQTLQLSVLATSVFILTARLV